MKKFGIIILTLVFAFSVLLTGCGEKNTESSATESANEETSNENEISANENIEEEE